MKTTSDIIQRLGGVSAVAADLSAPYQTVHAWIVRGFPAHRCVEIREIAKKRRVRLSLEQILSAQAQGEGAAT